MDNKKSFAMEMMQDLKRDNRFLKVLLGISIIANIILVLFK